MTQNDTHAQLFGWNIKPWLAAASAEPMDSDTQIIYCGVQSDAIAVLQTLNDQLLPWQSKLVNFDEGDLFSLAGKSGPLVILRPRGITEGQKRDGGLLAPSPYALARDLVGRAFVELKKYKSLKVKVRFRERPTGRNQGRTGRPGNGGLCLSRAGTRPKPRPPSAHSRRR